MIIIASVDDNKGLSFNGRRQSQDRILRKEILDETNKDILWMNSYSCKLFSDAEKIREDNNFLEKAQMGEYCFVENISLKDYADTIEKIILYKWNKTYPADLYFDIPLNKEWKLKSAINFKGYSHDKITKEVYEK